MKFIDEVKIQIQAGNGGNGCLSFRREKYVPHGGPDGGNGGKGGDVILVTDPGLSTLLDLRYKSSFKAKRGEHGRGKDQHGRGGKDILIRVPVGTVVWDEEKNLMVADLVKPGQRYQAAGGGKGGRGNHAFASSTNRAPRKVEPGEKGEERTLRLELKLLADVGLIGRPNAGKSTLISRISAARPKIADYPFTTLQPKLGVVPVEEFRHFTVADIPGLIEGAHRGAGMGIRFLKHIERTRLFLHLIDLMDPEHSDPLESYLKIDAELNAFSDSFKQRERWVVFTKIDLISERQFLKETEGIFKKKQLKTFSISSVTGEGIAELIEAIAHSLTLSNV